MNFKLEDGGLRMFVEETGWMRTVDDICCNFAYYFLFKKF